MKFIYTFLLIPSMILLMPFYTSADTVLRISDTLSLDDDQTVEGDFYGFTGLMGPVSMSGEIKGDAHIVGSSITANGSINEDLFAVGGTAQVHASVTDDVRIVAGEVTIADYVGGDVFVIGAVLTILSSAQIEGNVFFFGGEGEINGVVGGSIFGASKKLRIDGPVGGSVDVKTSEALVIGDRADIAGDVSYSSPSEVIRAQNAIVVGNVIKNSSASTSINPKDALVPFLIYAFSTLIIFAIFRRHLRLLMMGSVNSPFRNFLVGFVGVGFLPVVSLFLMVTVIGFIIGLFSLFVILSLYTLAFLLTGIFMGFLLNRLFTKQNDVTLLWTLAGILVTEAIFVVPIIGSAVVLFMVIVVFGYLLSNMYQKLV